jgi:hypothetical protein
MGKTEIRSRARRRLGVILLYALCCPAFIHCGGNEPIPQPAPRSHTRPSEKLRIAYGCLKKECARVAIQITQADYGNTCGNAAGNATDIVADLCNGKTRCDVYVHNTVFGDPFIGCPKGFDAVWTCGEGSRTAHHDPVIGEGYTVPLSCP